MTGTSEHCPETESYRTEEEIRKRLTYVYERRRSTPMKKRDMRLRYGQLTFELLLLQMKLRLVSGIEGEIRKRRLREVAMSGRNGESRMLIEELSRHGGNSNNKHMIRRFMKRYKSCH